MRGIAGLLEGGTYTKFNIASDRQGDLSSGNSLPLVSANGARIGFYSPVRDDLSQEFTLTYSDLLNKCAIVFRRDYSFPKITAYVNLPNTSNMAIPRLFIEENMRVEKINLISMRQAIDPDKVNAALINRKKANLFQRIFFEYVSEPTVVVRTKETPLGIMKSVKKKHNAAEI